MGVVLVLVGAFIRSWNIYGMLADGETSWNDSVAQPEAIFQIVTSIIAQGQSSCSFRENITVRLVEEEEKTSARANSEGAELTEGSQ
jgi:hypothetical protein